MALSIGDIVQITMSGTLLGETWSNVFYYSTDINGTAAPLGDCLANFTLAFIAEVMPIMSIEAQLRFTDAKDLTNGIDIASGTPSNVFGAMTGECMPSFVAWAFRLNRTNGTTRHGHKRFAGVAEANVSNGVAVAGMTTPLADAAAFLAAPVVEGDVTLWPVIVGRYPQTHAQAGELNLSVINSVASAAYIGVSTQNTRKPGRGI